jgi:hypothetical protein
MKPAAFTVSKILGGLMDTAAARNIEPFVDANRAAEFLVMTRRQLLEMARAGQIPAHPIGQGRRRQWRFRLSELAEALVAKTAVAKAECKISSNSAVPGNRIGGTSTMTA